MNHNSLNRRQLLQLSGFAGMGLLLDSCGLNQYSTSVGNAIDPLNQRVEELLLKPQALAREYPVSSIEPQALLINSFNDTPKIDPTTFKLIIDGAVNQPMQLSMNDIKKLPLRSMVIQHVCVEGWAAIVQWGGVRLKDLIALAQPKSTARYVYFESGDGYYNSWDLPSAMHPQTLLAYQKNGQPIPVDNGAPLRLAAPIKLGYKQSKWVTRVTLLDRLATKQGYWEDQGYEWFGGL
ncbi:molybdopterin-dependent oxidoreductase [Chamaesiphon polymorphus]|uniref:Oxidoreductase n=1 Tax=Chamaesiphon polymorphus CCALA 037 TaxID=2107692 RepID=A0A2T1GHN1_9CYAN|nr:molybdopterin-dependent oxidoreductase [Chamaesiphon polymorphus]PSB57103.1 oxidoreductase [Chamaesiphon polymorphus CCALA 037]